jgi:hypothetical protein
MTRQDYIDGLMWNGELNQFWWIDQESNADTTKTIDDGYLRHRKTGKYDCKSVVAINGIVDEFTDEELEKLYYFSQLKTKETDERYNDRMGTRKIIITKTPQNNLEFMKAWMAKFEATEFITPLDTLDEVLEYLNSK